LIKGFTAGKSARFIRGFTATVFLPFTGFDFFAILISLDEWIIAVRSFHLACHVSKRAVAATAAARLPFEIHLSGRVVPFGALLTIKLSLAAA
jgi:hypothetical protein